MLQPSKSAFITRWTESDPLAYLKSAKRFKLSFCQNQIGKQKKTQTLEKRKKLTESVIDLETVSCSPSIVALRWIHGPNAVTSDVKPPCVSDGEESCKGSEEDERKTETFHDRQHGLEKRRDLSED